MKIQFLRLAIILFSLSSGYLSQFSYAETENAGRSSQGNMVSVDPMSLVNPEFISAVDKQDTQKNSPDMTWDDFLKSLPQNRKSVLGTLPELRSSKISKIMVPGAKGAPDVRVFVINAERKKQRPAILHIHGGGFIMGSASQSLSGMLAEAESLDCMVVTVDYRLAPETPFPGALDDNYTALK